MQEVEQFLNLAYNNSELLAIPGVSYHAYAAYFLGKGMAEVSNSSEEELENIERHLEERRNELEQNVEKYGRQTSDLKEHLLNTREFFTETGYRIQLAREGKLKEGYKDPLRDDILTELFN